MATTVLEWELRAPRPDFEPEPKTPPGAVRTALGLACRVQRAYSRACALPSSCQYAASAGRNRLPAASSLPADAQRHWCRHFLPVPVWTVRVVAAGSPFFPFPYSPPSLPFPPSAAVGRPSRTPWPVPNPFLTLGLQDWPFPVPRPSASVGAGALRSRRRCHRGEKRLDDPSALQPDRSARRRHGDEADAAHLLRPHAACGGSGIQWHHALWLFSNQRLQRWAGPLVGPLMAEVGRKANEVGIPIAERTAALAAFEVRAPRRADGERNSC